MILHSQQIDVEYDDNSTSMLYGLSAYTQVGA